MSYLGKISAIVSANTSDFSAKLNASSKEVASWASSLQSAVNRASSKASSSLRGIYTEAQKAERALQAIQAKKINFKGFEGQNLATAVDRMRSLISATKGVNEPLNQAARSLEKLPMEMQGGFIKAMNMAQKQAELLAVDLNQIAAGTSKLTETGLERKFEAIASRAMKTAEAVERLKAAASSVDSLATGREIQFRNPEFAAEMARARGIQAKAAATPGGGFAGIIERQRAAADATAVAFARMEEAQLTIGGDVAGTTAEYQRQLAVLKSIGNELERAVSSSADASAPLVARARAEQDFYETSRRLQQQAAADEAAVLTARARAQQDFYETSERLQQQAAADAQIYRNIGATSDVAAGRDAANRRSGAEDFEKRFGGFGQMGIATGVDQRALRGVGAQIEYLQGRLVGLSAVARGPVVQAMERVRQVAATGFREGTIGTAAFNQQLQNATNNLTRVAAAALNIRPGRLAEQLRRVGDVARGSFGNVGLAIQQGIFAFDDFFSVTGGLDQRIRAAGNNISQLGFILGGTSGLITGAVVSAVAQLAVGILRWTGVTGDAEDQQNRLRLALESTNNALERQREIAKSVADSYRDMARSIRESGLSERGREELSRQRPMEEIKDKQAERRLAAIEASDPAVGRANAEIANIDERLRTEENAAERRRLLRQRQDAERRRRVSIETIEGRGQQNAVAAISVSGFDEAITQQQRALDRVRRQRGGAERRGNGGEADRLTREIAVIENTLQRIRDAAQNIGFAGADRAAQAFGRAQQNLGGISGATLSEATATASQAAVERAISEFGRGEIDFDELRRVISLQEDYGRATNQASIALKAFTEVMEGAAGSLARTVEQEVAQAADQARRQANAAEAEFGPADPRARFARNAQRELESEQRRLAGERAKIDEGMVKQRESFERDALNGIGDPRAVAIAKRMQEIDAALASQPTTQQEVSAQNEMRAERERLDREQRQIFQARPEVQAAARRADELDIQSQRLAQRQKTERERADRGRDLGLPPGAREAREAGEAIRDIAAARNRGDFGAAEASVRAQREAEAGMRSAAPAIFEMADAVANAVLQGPSRQALEVSDVSTMEGSRELNRLLRGDDQSKNANLVELQKQNQKMGELVTVMKDVAQKMGIVLDL